MKKFLSIGLLLSLSVGSVFAMNRGFAPDRAAEALSKNTARLKDTLAVDRAKVSGLKAQVRTLTKPAQTSPFVTSVLDQKEAKLAQKEAIAKETNKKLRANQATMRKKAKRMNIGKTIADTPKTTVNTVTGWFK